MKNEKYFKDLGARIRTYRKAKGMTQDELAKAVGYTSKAMISRIEKGLNAISVERVEEIANALGVDSTELIRQDPTSASADAVKIPVLGVVRAGIPLYATENIIGYEEIPRAWTLSGDYFSLRIKGDSMSPYLLEGDTVVVRQQPTAENGDIVIAGVNGDEACVKRLHITDKGEYILQSLNPEYAPMSFDDLTIYGIVVESRREWR